MKFLNSSVTKKAKEYKEKQTGNKRKLRIAALCGVAVLAGTTYVLMKPAQTMKTETYCGYEEHTEHTEACYGEVQQLICGLSEEGHVHADDCWEEQITIICGQEETAGHTHSDECYEYRSVYVCGLEETEGHTHNAECYNEEGILTCQLPECEPHHHEESCLGTEEVLICGKEEIPAHYHTPECLSTELVLVCGKEEQEPHQHTEECYETVIDTEHPVCGLELHTHSLQCYSNPQADLESPASWSNSLKKINFTGVPAEDVLAVAKTQLGYAESVNNYLVLADGVTMNGYTRYGAMYNDPYGDWSAMFCAFCMNYADVSLGRLPVSGDCQAWVEELSQTGLYRSVSGYIPQVGDLVFFDTNYDARPDRAGFVFEMKTDASGAVTSMRTLEGDVNGSVQYVDYSMPNGNITGYCELPEATATLPEPAAEPEESVPAPEEGEEAPEFIEATEASEEELAEVYQAPDCDCGVSYPELIGHSDACARKAAVRELAEQNSAEELFALWPELPEDMQRFCLTYLSWIDQSKLQDLNHRLETAPVQQELTAESQGKSFELSGLLPNGASATVAPVEEAALETVKELVSDTEKEHMLSGAFDIGLSANGRKTEPDGSITVTIGGLDLGDAEPSELTAVVFHLVGVDTEGLASLNGTCPTWEILPASIDGEGNLVFSTNSFSVFYYTVDFHYNQKTFSIGGTESILLSELFERLEVDRSAADVVSAVFTNPTLLAVEQMEGDWCLTSLAPFNTTEVLTVTFKDGKVLELAVTDANPSGEINIWKKITSIEELDEGGSFMIVTASGYALGINAKMSITPVAAEMQTVDGHPEYFTSYMSDGYWWNITGRNGAYTLFNVKYSSNYLSLGSGSTITMKWNDPNFSRDYNYWTLQNNGVYLDFQNNTFVLNSWSGSSGHEFFCVYRLEDLPTETEKVSGGYEVSVYMAPIGTDGNPMGSPVKVGRELVNTSEGITVESLLAKYPLKEGQYFSSAYFGTAAEADKEGITRLYLSGNNLGVEYNGGDNFDSSYLTDSSDKALYIRYVADHTSSYIPSVFKEPDHHKYIDALRDGGDNTETDLETSGVDLTDLYRLYLTLGPESAYSNVDVLFVIDRSTSMIDYDSESFDATDILGRSHVSRQAALNSLLNGLEKPGVNNTSTLYDNGFLRLLMKVNPYNKISVVGFNKDEVSIANYGSSWQTYSTVKPVSGDTKSGTNYAAGLHYAKTMLDKVINDGNKKIMIFLSDGEPTYCYQSLNSTSLVGGFGSSNATVLAKTSSVITEFRNYYASQIANGTLSIYTIGVGDFDPTYLDQLSTTGGTIMSADFSYVMNQLENLVTRGVGYYSNLCVTDKLSEYVEFYTEDLDVLVEKVPDEGNDGDPEILYSGGSISRNALGQLVYTPGTIKEAGEGIIDSVVFDPVNKTVTAKFVGDYKEEGGYVYRLSFNVYVNQDAYDEYEDNFVDETKESGYDGVSGDDLTDYPGNSTSSVLPGFYSNDGAELSYKEIHTGLDDYVNTVTYEDPVVQVATTNLTVDKEWMEYPEFYEDQELTVILYRQLGENGEKKAYKQAVLSEDNDWTYTFANLPLRYIAQGVSEDQYIYTAEEVLPEGYENLISVNAKGDTVITNFREGTTWVTVEKLWSDAEENDHQADSVTVRLYADGEATETTAVLSKANDWTYAFFNLPKCHEDGTTEYVYTVEEEGNSEFYVPIVTDHGNGKFTILNRKVGETSVSVVKKWVGDKEASVQVELLKNGQFTGSFATLNEENNWYYKWESLPDADAAGDIVWSVREIAVDGYTTSIHVWYEGDPDATSTVVTCNSQSSFNEGKTFLLYMGNNKVLANIDGTVGLLEYDPTSKTEAPAGALWTASATGTSTTLKNGGQYLFRISSDSNALRMSSSSTTFGYSNGNLYYTRYGTYYYVTSGGTVDTNSGNAGKIMPYLYEYRSTVDSRVGQTDTTYIVKNEKIEKPASLSVDIRKTDATNSSLTLNGAKFTLYRETGNSNQTQIPGITPARWGTEVVSWVSDGTVKTVENLLNGVYFLVETEAPAGYKGLDKPVVFNVTTASDGTKTAVVENHPTVDAGTSFTTLAVPNEPIPTVELPKTGGTGLVPLYLLGAALMGTACLLTVKRRRGEKN